MPLSCFRLLPLGLALLVVLPCGANTLLRDLPADTWHRLPGTKLREHCASETAFPTIRGSGGCKQLIGSWSGGAYEEAGKRLWVWGGGHGDYYGNEIYAFGVEKLSWERVTDPTPATTLSADPMPDGNPISRHTYDGLAFMSHAGRLLAYGGSMAGNGYGTQVTWAFNPGTKTWSDRKPAGSGNSPTTNCCNFTGEYDPDTRKVYMRDPNRLCAYDFDRNEWTVALAWTHTWGPGKTVVDTRRKVLFTLGSKEFLAYDLTTGKDVSADWKTTGGEAVIDGYGVGAAYDSKADRLVAWVGGGPWALDLSTKVWTRMSSTGAPAAPQQNGTFGRFRYVADDNVFLLVNDVDDDVYAYKLTSGGGALAIAGPRPPGATKAGSHSGYDVRGVRMEYNGAGHPRRIYRKVL